ncbi:MAG: 4-hydroxy-tetrahydrodipicolinate reductase [Bacteroidales bacterium]|nr:4-hydroxy-tetrahydrodipicolinate reductase [Bacteroidales bacterium]
MKILISGYGKMGRMIEQIILSKGLDYAGWSEDITATPKEVASECVCIDFTCPDAFRSNYKFIAENFGAAVIGTTGWNDIHDEVVGYFAKCNTPMIYASNFSIGVNAMFAAADYLTKLIAKMGGYSATIDETHHIHKLDAPSGTAKSLGAIVDANMGVATPIESHRIGEVPGIHTLTLESGADKIVLTHEAFSREGFAQGAVDAAVRIQKLNGIYDYKDIIFN